MKKLMIALTAVAMTACVQAGTVKWSTGTAVYVAGSPTDYATGTLQLLAVAQGTEASTVWATVKDGTYTSIKDVALLSTGKIAATTFDYTNGSYDFYSVLVDGDNFFISDAKGAAVGDVGTAGVAFSLKATSQLSAKDAADGYQGAGWYSSVPEPTSGLLLLLGMAGLALRRRRA